MDDKARIEEMRGLAEYNKHHSGMARNLLWVLNKLADRDRTIAELTHALEDKETETFDYRWALNRVVSTGHNNDCIFCEFKDKEATRVLTKHTKNAAIGGTRDAKAD